MSRLAGLFRPELRELRPYRAASFADGLARLNANETPWRPAGDRSANGLNHYPDVRPLRLTAELAALYGLASERVLVTRGSSEAIDLLVRALCREGRDEVMICPPTFGMYAVYAQLQGAGVISVPLDRDQGYQPDLDAISQAWTARCKLLFLCSPNNPTGNLIDDRLIETLCDSLDGKAIVVWDGAYLEFAGHDASRQLLERHDNLVVLRTLSKAWGLAGTRCGALLGTAEVVSMVGRLLPPYSFPTPCADAVSAALESSNRATARQHVRQLCSERERVREALAGNPRINRVWPSDANFLLVESPEAQALVDDARAAGLLIRDFSWDRWTPGCVRITIGTAEQNDRLIEALH
ncbi:MAG TPA: histidinol-phosphate transaminase [Chromatiales bacterium]|nr:histidinol-phosphate transaminase [Chromatiales bacterium]